MVALHISEEGKLNVGFAVNFARVLVLTCIKYSLNSLFVQVIVDVELNAPSLGSRVIV